MVISIGSGNTITSLETALLTGTLQTRTWAFLSPIDLAHLVLGKLRLKQTRGHQQKPWLSSAKAALGN